jgi:microcystin-dependent protein
MGTPYLGEIKIVSFNFAPRGWALCNGQTLPINQNQALFSILGTTYGGNGTTTFLLPDLRGRVPVHTGGGFTLGQRGGEETHTLIQSEMPQHYHSTSASTAAPDRAAASGNFWAQEAGAYDASSTTTMSPAAIANTGGSQPHNNLAPFLVVPFVIALQGIFPSRN